MKIDPIHQFNIEPLFTIGHIGNHTIAFTNSSLYMLVAVAIISFLMLASGTQLVPGRLQSVAEISYEFVASTIRSTAGAEGMKFFPLIFSLFMFICVSNLVGIIPYTFTISSHLIVTAALALLVFFTVLIYGVAKNGLKFFTIFVPHGVPDLHPAAGHVHRDPVVLPAAGLPQRPSVRQHAGRPHRAEGVRGLRRHARLLARRPRLGRRRAAAGAHGRAVRSLEILVAFLQAYVFAILTCIYLNDAIHPGH